MAQVKNPPASAGDIRDRGVIPGAGRPLGGGIGYPFIFGCAGSLLLYRGFFLIVARGRGLLSSCSTQASLYCDFSCCYLIFNFYF